MLLLAIGNPTYFRDKEVAVRAHHKYEEWRQRWPKFIVDCRTDEAVALLQQYYSPADSDRPRYTGARFEAMAALNADPYSLGPADFLAVSMLSVNIPPRAAIRLLGTDASTITKHLKGISTETVIVDSPDALGAKSPANQLWRLLRDGDDGLGPTRTSKLLAAKRPLLVPIWDSFVHEATGLGTVNYWQRVQHVLTADEKYIWKWLGELKVQTPEVPPNVGELRILDVLLWMFVGRARAGSGRR
jgi:hypothetical protein